MNTFWNPLFVDYCANHPNASGKGVLLDFYRWMRRNGISKDQAERELLAVMDVLTARRDQ